MVPVVVLAARSITDSEFPLVTHAVWVVGSTATHCGGSASVVVSKHDWASMMSRARSPSLVTYARCVTGSEATSRNGPAPTLNVVITLAAGVLRGSAALSSLPDSGRRTVAHPTRIDRFTIPPRSSDQWCPTSCHRHDHRSGRLAGCRERLVRWQVACCASGGTPDDAPIAQLAEAADLKSAQCRFESDWGHQKYAGKGLICPPT
jgi:hypothetical protein